MNLQEIDRFFTYKLSSEKDVYPLLDKIKNKASKYLPAESLEEIQRAGVFAIESHAGQYRLSGEPYPIHILKATLFLMELRPDLVSIQACLLHDVIEDTPVTYEDVLDLFGQEVANLCEGLVKVSKIKYTGENRHLETIKKTFLAMAKDLRVIFIKLADRIHNIQTLHHHPNPKKQEKIALETMSIYVPVAKKLGLYQYQLYLENGCFKILHPDEFDKIVSYMRKNFSAEYAYVDKGIKKITTLLEKEGIKNFQVKGRLKSPYRVREKLGRKYYKDGDLSNIMDMLAFRVVTESLGDVYIVLGLVHKQFTPLIKKIKDYIAVPKFNGYQSIHTTVLGMFNFPTEIQIRTYEMDDVAEYGVAAHYGYSEHKRSVIIPQNQAQWIRKLQDLVNTYKESDKKGDFSKELNIEMLNKSTFLYTPAGDIIELPRGATVLDFAYHIHTEVGLKFKNALVNGDIKPIGYVPKSGDVVTIQTWKNKYTANKHQLDYLITPSAKYHLARFLKRYERDMIIKEATKELNFRLKNEGIALYGSKNDQISKTYNKDDFEKSMLDIVAKKLSYSKFISSVYKDRNQEKQQKTHIESPTANISDKVVIDDNDILNYQICPECKAKLGQKIIAKTGRYQIQIHNMSCKALKTVNYSNLLEAHRKGESPNTYIFDMVLQFPRNYSNVMEIIQKLSELNINVKNIGVSNDTDGRTNMTIKSEYKSPSQIQYLFNDLKNNHPYITIKSKTLS